MLACCLLHAVWCVLHVACCLLPVARCCVVCVAHLSVHVCLRVRAYMVSQGVQYGLLQELSIKRCTQVSSLAPLRTCTWLHTLWLDGCHALAQTRRQEEEEAGVLLALPSLQLVALLGCRFAPGAGCSSGSGGAGNGCSGAGSGCSGAGNGCSGAGSGCSGAGSGCVGHRGSSSSSSAGGSLSGQPGAGGSSVNALGGSSVSALGACQHTRVGFQPAPGSGGSLVQQLRGWGVLVLHHAAH